MRVHIGTDHAGFELKEKVVAHLREAGHDVVDHGAYTYDALDDYPPFCIEAAQAVVDELGSLGIVIESLNNSPYYISRYLGAGRIPEVKEHWKGIPHELNITE